MMHSIKNIYKKIRLFWGLLFLLFWWFCVKADNLVIMEELTDEEMEHTNRRIKFLWSNSWVRDNYQKAHDDLNFWERMAGWILYIDDIMNYLVFVVQFLGQLWLVVWTIFIIYAWYKYMLSIFRWWETPSSTVKNAIIWVIIVIFSYAIMRILTSLIWLN